MNSPAENIVAAQIDLLPESDLYAASSRFSVLRLDLLHPQISGNKWFKLQPYLAAAKAEGRTALVSFGGPWSNHLIALAAAGREFGFETTGIVRGEKPLEFSAALLQMESLGMRLRFTDRRTYPLLQTPQMRQNLMRDYPDAIFIPEGGRGEEGRQGAAGIMAIKGLDRYSHLCLAVGTGTSIAGMAMRSEEFQQLVGIPVLKGSSGFAPVPAQWMTKNDGGERIKMIHGFDEGGYAKHNPGLIRFMNLFYDRYRIPSDFVYTGKLFLAIARLSTGDYFPEASNVLMVHTGGLQGNRSLPAHSLHF